MRPLYHAATSNSNHMLKLSRRQPRSSCVPHVGALRRYSRASRPDGRVGHVEAALGSYDDGTPQTPSSICENLPTAHQMSVFGDGEYLKMQRVSCICNVMESIGSHQSDRFTSKGNDRFTSKRASSDVEIIIGVSTLHCVNNKDRVSVKLDAATVAFVSGWMVPPLKCIAGSQALSPQHVAPSQAHSVL